MIHLAGRGCEGYDAVRRYAMGWRRRRRAVSASQVYVPLVFAPGEAYQFEWSHEQVVLSGKTARVNSAHMRLRNERSTTSTTGTGTSQPATNGLAVQVVGTAALAVLGLPPLSRLIRGRQGRSMATVHALGAAATSAH